MAKEKSLRIEEIENLTQRRIGDRIKLARVEQSYSLNDLAKKSGVGISTIHKIENYCMVPTVTTLLKIAHGLGRSVNFFIEEKDSHLGFEVIRHQESMVSAIRYQRSLIRAVSSRFPNTRLEVHYDVIDKDGRSNGKGLLSHESEEVAICLKGRMELLIENEKVVLGPLDSIHIRGGIPHRWRNAFGGKTEVLFIFTPPLFS